MEQQYPEKHELVLNALASCAAAAGELCEHQHRCVQGTVVMQLQGFQSSSKLRAPFDTTLHPSVQVPSQRAEEIKPLPR